MVRITTSLIVLFTVVFNNIYCDDIVNAVTKVFSDCTLTDLLNIDKQHEPNPKVTESFVFNYVFENCNVPTLPNGFFKHVPKVRSMEFININLSAIEPFALNDLNDLEVLTICKNQNLTQLKMYSRNNLINLRELNVGNNNLRILDTYALRRYTKLIKLNLDNNALTEIPVGFFDFSLSIEILNFAHNSLKRIDAYTFKPLLHLLELNLAHNKITYIDRFAFTTTTRLNVLHLNGNQISTLDTMVFHNLASLTYLNLSENALDHKSFEEDIFIQNSKLLHLDISHNSLGIIHTNLLKGLRDLEILNASYNQITLLEPIDLNNLKFIDVSHNNLSQLLDDQFAGMMSIAHIYLSHNKINIIQSLAFSNLTKLQMLDLSYNLLKSDEFIEYVKPIQAINLMNNRLNYVNLTFFKHIDLVELMKNPWNCSWLIKTMAEKQNMLNVNLGRTFNDVTYDKKIQRIAQEIECIDDRDITDDQQISKSFIFIYPNEDCTRKFEFDTRKKNSAINTYPRTFSKLLSDEFDYKALLLWSLFAVCLVIFLIRLGRYCFDRSERKSEKYRLSQENKWHKLNEQFLANHKRT